MSGVRRGAEPLRPHRDQTALKVNRRCGSGGDTFEDTKLGVLFCPARGSGASHTVSQYLYNIVFLQVIAFPPTFKSIHILPRSGALSALSACVCVCETQGHTHTHTHLKVYV